MYIMKVLHRCFYLPEDTPISALILTHDLVIHYSHLILGYSFSITTIIIKIIAEHTALLGVDFLFLFFPLKA